MRTLIQSGDYVNQSQVVSCKLSLKRCPHGSIFGFIVTTAFVHMTTQNLK
jgi:hypothetical protein